MKTTPFELFLSDEVQALLDHFAALLDIRVTFFSAEGRMLRRGRQMANSDYCRMIQSKTGNLRRCVAMDVGKQLEAMKKNTIIDYQCHAGLREAIAPVYIHGQLTGYLMIGQFRITDTPPTEVLNQFNQPELQPKLYEAFNALPRISPEKLEDVLGLFKMLIDYIVVRELAVVQKDELLVGIDNYLERHCLEDVRFPEMAKKLGRSMSTISQYLRRNHQTSFKELLLEHRLRRVDEFWQTHPDATVAEAAFAGGFSDQFYFSRVFRRKRGLPPAEYRNRQFRKSTTRKIHNKETTP